MKRLLLSLLVASLALVGCRTPDRQADAGDELPLREMRTQLIQQMRAAGASPAQIRELQRQLDALDRQVKQMQRQMKRMEAADE